jgi:eukaryotic translation initiation factor 2-alpha kinase 4
LLESEEGKDAQYAAIQNRKLRREVTTISRITHKNIVRYYQAWVEGGETTEQAEKVKTTDTEEANESSSENDESRGWWTNSPLVGGVVPAQTQDDDTAHLLESISQAWNTADSDSSSSWEAENDNELRF